MIDNFVLDGKVFAVRKETVVIDEDNVYTYLNNKLSFGRVIYFHKLGIKYLVNIGDYI